MDLVEDGPQKKLVVDLVPGDKFNFGGITVSVISVARDRDRAVHRVMTLRPIIPDVVDFDESLIIELWIHKNLELELLND